MTTQCLVLDEEKSIKAGSWKDANTNSKCVQFSLQKHVSLLLTVMKTDATTSMPAKL